MNRKNLEELKNKVEELKKDSEYLGEKIDDGINTDRIAVWLYADLNCLIQYFCEFLREYLGEKEGRR